MNYQIIITEPVGSREELGGSSGHHPQKTAGGGLLALKLSTIWWMTTRMSPSDVRYAPPILLLGKDGGSTIRKKEMGYLG